MNSRFELIESIPDLRDSLKPNFKEQVIKKMRETWGNSINGVPLPSVKQELLVDEEPTEKEKEKELLTEKETEIKVEKEKEKQKQKAKSTMEKVSEEQNDIKEFESKLDFNFG